MFYYFKYYVILTSRFTQGASLCSTKSEKCYQSKMPLQPPEILCFNEHSRSLWDVFTCRAGLAGPGFLSWEGSRSTGHTEGASGVGLLTCRAVLRGKTQIHSRKSLIWAQKQCPREAWVRKNPITAFVLLCPALLRLCSLMTISRCKNGTSTSKSECSCEGFGGGRKAEL